LHSFIFVLSCSIFGFFYITTGQNFFLSHRRSS
jgi:hypothetical protein